MNLLGPGFRHTAAGIGLALAVVSTLFTASSFGQTVRVDITPSKAISFDPDKALGTSMDILPAKQFDRVYSQEITKEGLSAGWGPITYRQNTELSIAAWHWNPNGTWSDAAHQSGYFTGSTEPKDFIRESFGYPLPHRGNTRNGGSEHGYSRLTDGDLATYWKSNPYLTQKFTGESDALHPQWIVVDFGAPQEISALRIAWADPYAKKYLVQYWTGEDAMNKPTAGIWMRFPAGAISDGKGGVVTMRLSPEAVKTRFLRIWMTESSNTCDSHGADDPRNCAGYAVNEIYAGNFTESGDFVDLVKHTPGQNQTATLVSSIDPWHTAADIDKLRIQTGFDLFFNSGYTNHLPAMIPISMLYGTPEGSAAEIAYIEKRGYPISFVEMGEEPDGQYMLPEDYAALYIQWARSLRAVDPRLKLGGPVFEGVDEDIKAWPDSGGKTSWLARFLDYLGARGRLQDLAFVSFEHYPLAPCDINWSDLYREPELTRHILQTWREDGVPQDTPLMNTESNVSWELTEPMQDLFSALWLADSVGSFLTNGGAAYYHSPIQPEPLRPGCRGYSTYGNFVADDNLNIRQYTAQYFASRMINLDWVRHGAGIHKLYPASADIQDEAGDDLVTAYAVERPDNEWSIMVVNKDPSNAHSVRILFDAASGASPREFLGPVNVTVFGAAQYVWHPDGLKSYAEPDGPPATSTIYASPGSSFLLPKASVTVLRGSFH
ncbi:MAG TPA: discoidin domain-containing protein [Terriglobales bacterium]|nr:discoidin domain-containing protein [Terriglobales bacterium]